MSGTHRIIFLVFGIIILFAGDASGRNDLEVFGAPTPANQAKSILDGQFNLVVEEFSAPASGRQGEDISGSVAFSFRNEGPDPITESFMVRIILTDFYR